MWWRSQNGPPVDWTQLLRDLCSGSSRAQRRAFLAFSRIIEERLFSIGAHRHLPSCEDLIHDVIMSLLNHADSVREPAAWVRRAAYNAYVDWIRRESNRRRKLELLCDVPTGSVRVSDPLVEEAVLTKEDLRMLHDAIERLEPHLRIAIDTVYPTDPGRELPTLAKAADALRIRETTLKNRLRKATHELGRDIRRQRALGRFRRPRAQADDARDADLQADRESDAHD